MEYYIMKLYKSKKAEDKEVAPGFDRFSSKTKKVVMGGFIIMVAALIELIITTLLSLNFIWQVAGFLIFMTAFATILVIDGRDQKKHIDQYSDSYMKRLNILDEILLQEKFQINSREKLEGLREIYQDYIDESNKKEKRRNHMIYILFSALAGVLSISLTNLEQIEMTFSNWLYYAIIILVLFSVVAAAIYFLTPYDSLKKDYEMMVKDLTDLLVKNYY
ncbi:MAG: hypothetical protein ACI39H_09150 [Lachnospiraceae bacterium]